jgi:hypothetical protein
MTRRGLFGLIGAAIVQRKLPELKAAPLRCVYRGGRAEWVMKIRTSSLYGKFGSYDINSAYPWVMTHGAPPQ